MKESPKVLGIGGVFVKSAQKQQLYAWYKDVLGIDSESWGVSFPWKNCDENQYSVWSVFEQNTKYFEPSHSSFMINFIVNDLDSFEVKLNNLNVPILGKEVSEFGKFMWILDPDSNKIELWEPPKAAT
jgi:hypothetical protein